MTKRELLQLENKERASILAKMDDLDESVAKYFSKFTKVTLGKLSIGDVNVDFVSKCDEKIHLFPETIPQSFDVADFEYKFGGVLDYLAFKKRIMKSVDNWDISAKVCKTDSMFYANRFYSIMKEEAAGTVKYQPVLDELISFYKKKQKDKTDDTKPNGDTPPTPTT